MHNFFFRFNAIPTNPPSVIVEPVVTQSNFGFNLNPAQFSNENSGGGPRSGQILMQAAPAVDVTGQALRTQVFMTPLQMQMHQQLKAKHAELFKRIVEQQEELRQVSEKLMMTQYGIVPVNVAPIGSVAASGGTPVAAVAVTTPQHIVINQNPIQPPTSDFSGNLGQMARPTSTASAFVRTSQHSGSQRHHPFP